MNKYRIINSESHLLEYQNLNKENDNNAYNIWKDILIHLLPPFLVWIALQHTGFELHIRI